jgi:hypothetical protein
MLMTYEPVLQTSKGDPEIAAFIVDLVIKRLKAVGVYWISYFVFCLHKYNLML